MGSIVVLLLVGAAVGVQVYARTVNKLSTLTIPEPGHVDYQRHLAPEDRT